MIKELLLGSFCPYPIRKEIVKRDKCELNKLKRVLMERNLTMSSARMPLTPFW